MFNILKKDFSRYCSPYGFAWYEPSLLVIVWYRFGQWGQKTFWGMRHVLALFHRPISIILTLLTGIQLPRGTKIGPGLRIYHFGGIFIHPNVVIGKSCTLRHEVTIGTCRGDFDVPIIGDNVEFGAGAKVLGQIHIGNNVTIGANAVVLADVPDNCIAVGIPAKNQEKHIKPC